MITWKRADRKLPKSVNKRTDDRWLFQQVLPFVHQWLPGETKQKKIFEISCLAEPKFDFFLPFFWLVCVVGWEQWWELWPDHLGRLILFVLYSVLRVFSLGTLIFPSHQKHATSSVGEINPEIQIKLLLLSLLLSLY